MIKKLIAEIIQVQSVDNLNIVTLDIDGQIFTMMSLELSNRISKGLRVSLHIKATSIALAKNLQGELSYENQLQAKILSVINGELLSSIVISIANTPLESIITLNSSLKMNLKVGDEVTALIKENEISIAKLLQ